MASLRAPSSREPPTSPPASAPLLTFLRLCPLYQGKVPASQCDLFWHSLTLGWVCTAWVPALAPLFSPAPTPAWVRSHSATQLSAHLVSWVRAAAKGPEGGRTALGIILTWSSWARGEQSQGQLLSHYNTSSLCPAATSISPTQTSSQTQNQRRSLCHRRPRCKVGGYPCHTQRDRDGGSAAPCSLWGPPSLLPPDSASRRPGHTPGCLGFHSAPSPRRRSSWTLAPSTPFPTPSRFSRGLILHRWWEQQLPTFQSHTGLGQSHGNAVSC